jgi:sn-glycerol 3-phosphate transport system permease protein
MPWPGRSGGVDQPSALFQTFAIIHTMTSGGPAARHRDSGVQGVPRTAKASTSAAQSVILMLIAIAPTLLQYRYVERRGQYQ